MITRKVETTVFYDESEFNTKTGKKWGVAFYGRCHFFGRW